MKSVLVLSPHPDDEAIGCGGALCADIAEGNRVTVIFLTSGEEGGHDGLPPPQVATLREAEARQAAEILGVHEVEFWRQPDGRLRGGRGLADRLADRVRRLRPQKIYAPHPREEHPDHRAAYRLMRRVAALAEAEARLLLYEVWTPMPRMDHIVDISPYIETKLAAIRAYHSQCSALRFDDAMRGLARYRGEMHSWPGGEYAEVFQEVER